VQPGDVAAYVAMRCDPVMMAELGGPLPRDGIEAKVAADVATVRSGAGWIMMIVPDPADPGTVAGSVVVWSHPADEEPPPDPAADAAGAPPTRAAGGEPTAAAPENGEDGPLAVASPGAAAVPVPQISEIGWMVLPAYQGRGLARRAVSRVLDLAAADGRWGTIHAFPGVTNAASNALCRSLGFTLVGTVTVDFQGRPLTCHHWRVDPGAHRSP
jgi:RimJ/RimL family protein N-acetyltransferase